MVCSVFQVFPCFSNTRTFVQQASFRPEDRFARFDRDLTLRIVFPFWGLYFSKYYCEHFKYYTDSYSFLQYRTIRRNLINCWCVCCRSDFIQIIQFNVRFVCVYLFMFGLSRTFCCCGCCVVLVHIQSSIEYKFQSEWCAQKKKWTEISKYSSDNIW